MKQNTVKWKRHHLVIGLLLVGSLFLSGCRLIDDPATQTPIIVTATPAEPSITPTNTPVLGIAPTSVRTPEFVPTIPTATPTLGATLTPTLTPSFTITPTDTPAPTLQARTCPTAANGGFAAIYSRDVALQAALGCPTGVAVGISSASQDFEQGRMVWASQLGELPTEVIYVLFANGTYQRYDDTWIEGVDPSTPPDSPPAGRTVPMRGFGKVWMTNAPVKNGLGWALVPEAGTGAQIQRFERGEMLYLASLNQTFVFVQGAGGGTWRVENTPY